MYRSLLQFRHTGYIYCICYLSISKLVELLLSLLYFCLRDLKIKTNEQCKWLDIRLFVIWMLNFISMITTCWVLARVWICPWTTCAPETGCARRMYCSWPVFSCTYSQSTQGGDKVWFSVKVIWTKRSQPFCSQQWESFTLLWWIVNVLKLIYDKSHYTVRDRLTFYSHFVHLYLKVSIGLFIQWLSFFTPIPPLIAFFDQWCHILPGFAGSLQYWWWSAAWPAWSGPGLELSELGPGLLRPGQSVPVGPHPPAWPPGHSDREQRRKKNGKKARERQT